MINKYRRTLLVTLFFSLFKLWGCQDFSRFDCLNDELGCQFNPMVVMDKSVMTTPLMDQQIPQQDMFDDMSTDIAVRDLEVNVDMLSRDMLVDMTVLDMEVDLMVPDMEVDMEQFDMLPDHCQQRERCDSLDNDCDGEFDEDLASEIYDVPFATLNDFDNSCTEEKSETEHCRLAAHSYCQTKGCNQVGIGPVYLNRDMNQSILSAKVLCLPASMAVIHTETYETLKNDYNSKCDSESHLNRDDCRFYVFQRYCSRNPIEIDNMTVTSVGVGPLISTQENVSFACVTNVTNEQITFSDLLEHDINCRENNIDSSGVECNQAIHLYCRDRRGNYLSGWGPLNKDGSNLGIACVPAEPTITP